MKKEKGNESVCMCVNVEGRKLVLGTLMTEKLPQQQFDLVFDRDFELSHNWKNGSVYFYGYKANNPFDEYPLNCNFPIKLMSSYQALYDMHYCLNFFSLTLKFFHHHCSVSG